MKIHDIYGFPLFFPLNNPVTFFFKVNLNEKLEEHWRNLNKLGIKWTWKMYGQLDIDIGASRLN
jgi:hypothetical protein